MLAYVQPIAQHAGYAERLLLCAEDDRYYVWFGEHPDAEPEEIDEGTAAWLLTLPVMRSLSGPLVWLHAADLPLSSAPSGLRLPHDRHG